MKRTTVLAFCCVAALATLPSPARAAAKAERSGDLVVMQNDLVRLTIHVAKGARVSEYVYAPFGENIVYPVESSGGLLMDHVWEQTWPGEFLNRAYEAVVNEAGPAQAVVTVASLGTGETIRGLRLERRLTLKDGDRALYVTVTLTNTTAEGRVTGYWSQNNYWFGGRKEGVSWARPAIRGIDRLGLDAKGESWFGGSWFYVDDATAGWNGGYSRELRRGMMFLMDYNDLWRIYDNTWAVTTEWMYDSVAIPGGKAWSTAFVVIPVAGITGFTHGSARAVANLEVAEEAGGLTLTHQVARGTVPLKDVTLATRVWGLKKPWTATVPEARFAELKDDAQTAVVKATDVGAMPAGVEVTLTGTTSDGQVVKEVYGDYYGGAEGKNNDPFVMKPYLAFARPAKQKVYLKPDVIQYLPNETPRVLYLRGLWTQVFGVDPALSNAVPGAATVDGWLDASPVGLTLSYWPSDYPSLLNHDLIVLGNVPAAPLDLVGQEMLKDYLEAGGNLLLLGGDQAYGQAGFSNAGLTNAIPLALGGPYNWRKLEKGKLRVTAAHPVTEGVRFEGRDRVFYSHLCTPRAGAFVAVMAGDRPILVLSETPRGGRIACVLAAPFGEAGRGETAFWDAPAWQRLMENTLRWLLRR
jgi:hypothetical protein